MKALVTSLGGKVILGVTLKVNADINTQVARTEVTDFGRFIGANVIDAFELGNEPEFYPLSVVHGGRGIDTVADCDRKFSKVAAALGQRQGRVRGSRPRALRRDPHPLRLSPRNA